MVPLLYKSARLNTSRRLDTRHNHITVTTAALKDASATATVQRIC